MNTRCDIPTEVTRGTDGVMRPAARAQHPNVAPPEPLRNDALLEASRRVDWRFLLPDPNLGEVLYVGPEHSELGKSLKLFSAALTAVDGLGGLSRLSTQYDTVVLAEPDGDVLEAAAGFVRPSAFLYVEARTTLTGITPWRPRKRMRFVADYLAAVRRLGFERAEAYWHWPDFNSCAELVPLGEPTSLLHALGRRRTTLMARGKTSFCRGLVHLGVFSYFVPCFSLVAQRNTMPQRNGQPPQHLAQDGRQR